MPADNDRATSPVTASRRRFLRTVTAAALGAAFPGLPAKTVAQAETEVGPMASKPKVRSRKAFAAAAGPGVTAWVESFYTRGEGLEKMSTVGTSTRSDTTDTLQRRFSADNGRTWSEWEPIEFITETGEGVRREYPGPGWVDPRNGRLVTLVLEGLLPSDNPMEGMKHWFLRYRVSTDGGRTDAVDEQIVQKGDYTPEHPLEGVWVGKNSAMIGAATCRPIRTRRGHILVPVQITPIGPDGEYYNPGGGYTYHEAAALIGTWTDGLRLEWDLSERVANDPARSTRGCVEPTIAEMPDGRVLMVMRGSNDVKPDLPGYKWYAVSDDGGFTWGPPAPWTYADGSPFYSPSSCSQLLRHSSGRYYWLGNITPTNPRGNSPRYPLVIGEVDPDTLMLIKGSTTVIDDRGPDEDASLQLSNFLAYEDREDGHMTLHVTRFFPNGWRGDAYVYEINV